MKSLVTLLTSMFMGFMLIYTQVHAQGKGQQQQRVLRQQARQQVAAIDQAAVQPVASAAINQAGVQPARTAATFQPSENQQDIVNIVLSLREVQGLMRSLASLPTATRAALQQKISSSPEPMTIGQVRANMNALLRGGRSVTPGQPATGAQPAAPRGQAVGTQPAAQGRGQQQAAPTGARAGIRATPTRQQTR